MSRVRHRNLANTVAAAASLLCLVGLALALGHGEVLLRRAAWIDEYYTLLVAGRGTVADSVRALARGADFNPPLLFLLVRAFGHLTGGVDVTGLHMLNLRLFAVACTWLALSGVYVLLRRRYDALSSIVASFALLAHPLVARHLYEVRFYGPWLLFCVLFVGAVTAAPPARPWLREAAVAVTAILLCVIHYFGVIAWGLILAAYVLGGGRRRWASTVVPAIAGPAALAACLPLYLGQRAAMPVTWVSALTPAQTREYLTFVFTPLALVAVLIAWGAAATLGWMRQVTSRAAQDPGGNQAVRCLVALGLMPLVLIAFSAFVQPALVHRYSIPAVLLFPPLVAEFARALRPAVRLALLGLLLVAAIDLLRTESWNVRSEASARTALVAALREHVRPGDTVAFESRHVLYPIANLPHAPGVGLVYVEVGDAMVPRATKYDIAERDAGRAHARLYGFPTLRPVEVLRQTPCFWLVVGDTPEDRPRGWFPEHRAVYVAPMLSALSLAGTSCSLPLHR